MGVVGLKNRDKYILKANEYDMLVAIQTALNYGERCVLNALTKKTNNCIYKSNQKDCEECIQAWLNKEN